MSPMSSDAVRRRPMRPDEARRSPLSDGALRAPPKASCDRYGPAFLCPLRGNEPHKGPGGPDPQPQPAGPRKDQADPYGDPRRDEAPAEEPDACPVHVGDPAH